MQPEGPIGQEPTQQPFLDDLQDDRKRQEQESGRDPADREAGEAQDRRHEKTADVWDEPGSEHEHGQGPRERDADERQDDEAHDRIDCGDGRRSAHVPAGASHGFLARVPDPVALPAAEPGESDVPGLVPVEEQVEGQEETEHHDRAGFDQ